MTYPSILAITPLYQQPEIFRVVAENWKKVQGVVKWVAFNDHSPEETVEIAREFMEVVDSGEPAKSNYVRDGEDTHVWDIKTMDRMARIRNRMWEYAMNETVYSLYLFIDSDVLIAPGIGKEVIAALKSIPASVTDCNIISPIYWSKWKKDGPELPQVWDYHSYGFKGIVSERLQELRTPGLHEVGGLGAVTFVTNSVFNNYGDAGLDPPYTPIESLRKAGGGMMNGEDRWFCIRAECAGYKLYGLAADPPLAYHIYRDTDLGGIEAWERSVAEQSQREAGERKE